MDGKTRRESMREGREKFGKLSFKEKLGYLWDYYKWVPALVVVLAVVIAIGVHVAKDSRKETVLSAAIINGIKNEGNEGLKLSEGFAEYIGLDPKTQSLSLDDTYLIKLADGDQVTVACQTKLMAAIQGETLDLMVMPEDIYRNYLASGAIVRLDEALDGEFLEEEKERWQMDRRGEDTEDGLYALRVTGSKKLEPLYGSQEVYAAVPAGAGHREAMEEFLKYLLH